MTPEQFMECFGVVAEAEGGIKRLRSNVLSLGVLGKLTATASEPADWEMRPLEDCAEILDSKRIPVKKEDRERRIEGKKQGQLYPYYGATQQAGWIDDYLFDHSAVLLGEDGAPFLDPDRPKAYLVEGRYWVNNHAHVLKGLLLTDQFLCHALNVVTYEGLVSGTTRLKLTQKQMKTICLPVPPLPEQHRIVAKVDQLMAMLDDLEQRQAKKRTAAIHLSNALLNSLVQGDMRRNRR